MTDAGAPRVILGTMTFGQQVEESVAGRMLEGFFERGGVELDSAHIYSQGRSEEILGRLLKGRRRESYQLASKVHPSMYGGLSAKSVRQQLQTSLDRLQTDAVDLLYLHQPDPETPIEVTLEACAELQERGLFGELGLSNYAAWQVADIVRLGGREGWPIPTVYQGMYNALTREVERELFPCLRAMGMRFYVYNPLAGGVLSGKYKWGADVPGEGRFKEYGFYVERYWKQSYVAACTSIGEACVKGGIVEPEAALRWLARHSNVDAAAGDGVIIGASKLEHVEANHQACRGAELPESIVAALEGAWQTVRPDCPKYFRP
jgi:aflatoxin B1 aldehyde reductase